MKTLMKKIGGAIAIATFGVAAHAATLSAVPSASAVEVGDIFSVAIDIGDLIDAGAPSLGAFDLDIQFDAGVLSYTGFTWGDAVLGDQLDLAQLGSLNGYDDSNAALGSLNFYEVSLDDSSELDAMQAGSFGLLTLTFSALATGTSPLALNINALSDAAGNELSAQINNGAVTVNAVPLPATLPLFVSALLLAAGRRRHRH